MGLQKFFLIWKFELLCGYMYFFRLTPFLCLTLLYNNRSNLKHDFLDIWSTFLKFCEVCWILGQKVMSGRNRFMGFSSKPNWYLFTIFKDGAAHTTHTHRNDEEINAARFHNPHKRLEEIHAPYLIHSNSLFSHSII